MSTVKPHPNNSIALLCTLHASSPSAKQTVQSLLHSGRSYYASPKSQCTTWTYFTPSKRPKAPSQLISKSDHDTVLCGMEIYSDKQALSTQMKESWFQSFGERVKKEGLYDTNKANGKGEDMVAWYPVAGFVAREESKLARPFGHGVVVMLAVFTCKEGKKDQVVKVLSEYISSWVASNEPDVLTYCVLTRPKAPNEIVMFERYKDHKALGSHGSTKQFKGMFKGIAPHIEVKQTKIQEFMELDDAFVSNVVGVESLESQNKSKL